MTVTGDTHTASEPIRTCVGCRVTGPQRRLLRFTRRDDGHVVPANVSRSVSGRSAYLCPRRTCFAQAIKRRAFARAFGAGRRSVSVIEFDADALMAAAAEQLRREIDLLGRTADTDKFPGRSAAESVPDHPRRRGLEQLLSELSSQKSPPGPAGRGPTQPQAIVTEANEQEPHTPREGGAPSHG